MWKGTRESESCRTFSIERGWRDDASKAREQIRETHKRERDRTRKKIKGVREKGAKERGKERQNEESEDTQIRAILPPPITSKLTSVNASHYDLYVLVDALVAHLLLLLLVSLNFHTHTSTRGTSFATRSRCHHRRHAPVTFTSSYMHASGPSAGACARENLYARDERAGRK